MSVVTEAAVREPRYCLILVLSPGLRSNADSTAYKPFDRKVLLDLFDEVSHEVPKHHRSPLFEKHAIYNNFYFGAVAVSTKQVAELRRLSSAIVDCTALVGTETTAIGTAAEALQEFMYDEEQSKKLILTCRDRCGRKSRHNDQPVYSDEELYQVLFGDLCGNLFVAIQRRMELRSR
jgi:hypothetical protein